MMCFFEADLIQFVHSADEFLALAALEALGIRDVQHRIANGAQLYPLILAGQETRAPHAFSEGLPLSGDHDHESRQILIFASQTIRDPSAEAGTPGQLESRLEERRRRIVV